MAVTTTFHSKMDMNDLSTYPGGRPVYFDKTGRPIGMEEWIEKHNDRDYSILRHDIVGEGLTLVSTVWLGLDHAYTLNPDYKKERPVIFETMIFPDFVNNAGAEDYCERYYTEEAALAGHDQALAYAKDKYGP